MAYAGDTKTRQHEPIFGIGNHARSAFLSTVDRVNAVVELTEGGRQPFAVVGLPGLVTITDFSPNPARGIFVKPGTATFYIAAGSEVFRVTPGETIKILDLGTTEGLVWMDENGVDLFINDGLNAYLYRFETAVVTQILSVDFPAGARGGTYLQGRFFVFTTSRIYASGLLNGSTWSGLDFFEPTSSPDGILAIARQSDNLMIIGTKSVEWWSAQPTPIPGALGFQPSASANTEIGGLSETGFTNVGEAFLLVGVAGGTPSLWLLNGYRFEPIGTEGLTIPLSTLANKAAVCTGYAVAGHPLLQITIQDSDPTQAMTWIYDVTSQRWSRRQSAGKPYYRGLYAVDSLGSVYITDAFTGKLYRMQEGLHTEDGETLPFIVTSQHLLNGGDSVTIHEITIDLKNGVGNPVPPGDDPHAILSVSKDGGRTWPIERHITMGKAGEYLAHAKETQFGCAHDWAIRLTISEPVPREVAGAFLIMDPNYA
jgi:hypothetical protein